MQYTYRARDPQGKLVQGSLGARNADDANAQLRRQGFSPLQVRPSGDYELDDEDDEQSDGDDEPGFFSRRVSRDQLIYVTNQLAIMSETGITLSTALGSIVAQEAHPGLRYVLNDLKAVVEAGGDFSEALARHPRVFDKTYVALVRASEQTGGLAEMLTRIANYQRKELETRNKVRSAMAYPAVMGLVAVAVSVFLLTYIFPKFSPLFERKGMDLPAPTLVMMTISNTMTNYWWGWLIGIALAVVGLIASLRTEQGRLGWDWLKIQAPLLGPMFRKVIISRGIRTLGTMLASGVPTLEALRLCAEISANRFYERLWLHVESRVTEGSAICSALAGSPLLPPTLIQMISAGEDTGKLDIVLEHVSGYYDKEVENSIKAATSMIEPIMMTIMGVVVGGIALALMLPIFSLTKNPG